MFSGMQVVQCSSESELAAAVAAHLPSFMQGVCTYLKNARAITLLPECGFWALSDVARTTSLCSAKRTQWYMLALLRCCRCVKISENPQQQQQVVL